MSGIQLLLITILLSLSTYGSKSFAASTKKTQATEIATFQTFDDEDDFDDFDSYEPMNISEIRDPLENYNRKIFAFNDTLDRYFFEHVAKAYRKNLPRVIRTMVRNFLTNLSLPISTFNSLVQGKTENGLATFSNFLINSTIGIGGLFDVAGKKNIKYNKEDFGQTLGYYGSGPGIYIVIPIFGPSSTRDLTGLAVDKSINPIDFNLLQIGGERDLINVRYRIGLAVASGIDTRENLLDIIEDVRNDSFDFYATVRSAYIQKRNTDIKN